MKTRLVESFIVPASAYTKIETPLTEAVSVDGTPYKALAVYRFPFTRPGQKNLNGRIYPHALWDKVFAENLVTVSLIDHPEEDDAGDPARIWAVMRNPGYNKNRTLGLVDCYIIDNELGRTVQGVLEAGGTIGLSSSGFGDFEVDGITVSPETFSLERFADLVLAPSYSVFGSIDDKIFESFKETETMNNNDNSKKELTEMANRNLSLREKRELEASLKKIYEDVKNIKSVHDRLNRAREALTFYEDTDVESYKGEFEELVKEAEKEFEDTLAKGEQIDAVKKKTEEISQMVKKSRKKVEDLKKENEFLKKENNNLKTQLEKSKKLENKFNGLLASMVENTRRSIPYEKYEELRRYAIKATKFYSEMKLKQNLLQIETQEMTTANRSLEEARRVQDQKDAIARARMLELRQKKLEAKTLSEQRLREAKEAEFMRNVKPEVLEYYNDLIRMGENVSGFREQILSRRTLMEAQMLVLKAKHKKTAQMAETIPDMRDISTPLPVKNYHQIMPDTPMIIPKGFI